MNIRTVKSIIRCGYSLYSKDLFVHLSISRVLYNCSAEQNYSAPWSKRPNHKLTPQIGFKQWNVNNSIGSFDHHRYISTSLPYNSQTALKLKSPDHNNGDKRHTKETVKPSAGDKVENQSSNVADKVEDVLQVEEKLTLVARFKKMYKEYWYVLVPVHVVTSCFWFTGFYYLSTR